MSVLSQPGFHDEAAAFAYLEGLIWADGKVCPHCGFVNGRMYDLAVVRGKLSKKGISSHQLSRILEIQYNSAWFLSHRIREPMRSGDLAPFGSGGGIVELDETCIGRVKGAPVKRGFHHRMKVLALVDRDSGKARTMVVENVTAATLMPIVRANIAKEATIMTDEHTAYTKIADHGTTTHSLASMSITRIARFIATPLRAISRSSSAA